MNRKPIFDAVRGMLRRGYKPAEIKQLDAAIDQAEGRVTVEPTVVTPKPPVPSIAGAGKTLAGIVGAGVAATLLSSVPQEEGWKLRAYKDIAGIWTICGGDTKNVTPGMLETEAGCQRRLEAQLIAHAEPIVKCSPRLLEPGREGPRAAAISLGYNIGVGAFCKSSIDKRFDVGDWTGGCNGFMAWNKARVNGTLRPVLGLTRRRERERELCLKGAAA